MTSHAPFDLHSSGDSEVVLVEEDSETVPREVSSVAEFVAVVLNDVWPVVLSSEDIFVVVLSVEEAVVKVELDVEADVTVSAEDVSIKLLKLYDFSIRDTVHEKLPQKIKPTNNRNVFTQTILIMCMRFL